MVKYQRKNLYSCHLKKSKECHVSDEEDGESCLLDTFRLNISYNRRARPKLFYFLVLCMVSCILALAALFVSFSSHFLHEDGLVFKSSFICSSATTNGSLCCDRSSHRSDICVMKGDVRTDPTSNSVVLYKPTAAETEKAFIRREKIRPYTRKWESQIMNTIDELSLAVKKHPSPNQECDVSHRVPAVFFSTGGYTGNLYHEFNDGILPLYITAQRFDRKVVFFILEYHNWWVTKYGDVLSQLSDFPPVDFDGDKRVHCFPQAIVGLRIHGELTVDSSSMEGNKTIKDFHDLLDRAYWPRIKGLIEDEERQSQSGQSLNPIIKTVNELKKDSDRPKLAIVSRNGSRAVTNEGLVVKMAEEIGFEVEVLKPQKTTELAKVYRVLNSSDVVMGVHGAAMTHFLFMRAGSVFIQIVPLGTKWAAENYYGEPGRKLGLKYIGYEILPRESSLYDEYDMDDPVLADPGRVNHMGWEYTKRIYLDRQMVRLDLGRFGKRLLRAYYYTIARKNQRLRIS